MTAEREVGTWVIGWNGHEWSEDDLTGAHAAIVTLMSGKDAWSQLDPFAGPVTLIQIIAAFVSVTEKRDPVAVASELGMVPLTKLLAAVSLVE